MSDTFEKRLAKLEVAIERIEAETREANSAAKSLRDARREVETMLRDGVRSIVDEAIAAEVKRGLDEYRTTLNGAVKQTEAALYRRFDQLTNTLLTGRKSGDGESLVDLARRLQQ